MSRPIITEELVTTTAEAMIAEGAEPSIVAVHTRIGGGSFTSVKRFLDVWRSKRAAAHAASLELPADVEAKGKEFSLALWAVAKQLAAKEAQAAKEAATADVEAARQESAQALQEIARLEASEAQRAEIIGQQETKIRELELGLAEAQAQARRTAELEKALEEARGEAAAAHKEAAAKAVEAGRLMGETDALRKQVTELLAAITSFGKGNG